MLVDGKDARRRDRQLAQPIAAADFAPVLRQNPVARKINSLQR
jgi:hypothetical protein